MNGRTRPVTIATPEREKNAQFVRRRRDASGTSTTSAALGLSIVMGVPTLASAFPPPHRIAETITAMADAQPPGSSARYGHGSPSDHHRVRRDAALADKAEVYRHLGLQLNYQAEGRAWSPLARTERCPRLVEALCYTQRYGDSRLLNLICFRLGHHRRAAGSRSRNPAQGAGRLGRLSASILGELRRMVCLEPLPGQERQLRPLVRHVDLGGEREALDPQPA